LAQDSGIRTEHLPTRGRSILSVMFALFLVSLVAADLPVHCLRHEVAGEWTFNLGEPSSSRSKCGHQTPDVAGTQPSIEMSQFQYQSMKVSLNAPASAMVNSESGSWSMVYDEGFQVDAGMKSFFAFNSFDGSIAPDGNIEKYSSDCTKTQVGWYTDGDQYGCFVATKGVAAAVEAPVAMMSESFESRKSPMEALDAILAANNEAPALLQEHTFTREEHQAHVDKINSKQTGWTAKVYDNLVNKSHKDLNKMSGIARAGVKKTKEAAAAPSFLQLDRNKVSYGEYPRDFDWRNKDGKNYVVAPVDQGSCGSCYVISSISMLSSRRKVLEDNVDAEPFSAQFPLFCSDFNQGCDGGYPELVAKWSHDVGLVPESCGSYNLGDQSCRLSCDVESSEKYKVGEYGYIGGYYGASTEENMMEEIHNRGPVAIAIEPTDDFMYYNSGVYEHGSAIFTENEWTKVDHAVLITGWGEDDGKKYWRVQNSWGRQWGEDGTVRIKRGVDESAVEAQAIFGTVEKTGDSHILMQYTR